ncbi:MAG TPA: citrate lyase holo-[acyl-carrier protein] synthase [Desulfuromonadales bacterium]
MSYAKLKSELLAARDRRHAALLQVLGQGWRATLFLSLAIPGADKIPAGTESLFAWARQEAEAACGGRTGLREGHDRLGPFAILGSAMEPVSLKRICVELEAVAPFARLIDADVYDPQGAAVDRAFLGLPPRPCLVCDAPAKDCIRLGHHDEAELSRRVYELLAPFTG